MIKQKLVQFLLLALLAYAQLGRAECRTVAITSESPFDLYSELLYADNFRHPVIDCLGWREIIRQGESDLDGAGFWDDPLEPLRNQLELLRDQGLGVLPVEEPMLASMLVKADNRSHTELKAVLTRLLLVDGRRKLQQLRPYLDELRRTLLEMQANKQVCETSDADLGWVQALVSPYVTDDWVATQLEQLKMVSSYKVDEYAHNVLGLVALPEVVEAKLKQAANPSGCLEFEAMESAVYTMVEVLPPASQAAWQPHAFTIEQDPERWFREVSRLLDPARLLTFELEQRRYLLTALLAYRQQGH